MWIINALSATRSDRFSRLLSALIVVFGLAAPSQADPLTLDFPLDCMLGETCFIQHYVDRILGEGAQDFMCGGRTYQGHKGTDIRVIDLAQMQSGVSVLAAAVGTVVGARNDMADISQPETPTATIAARECGNGVVLDHGDGWQTLYCHLRRGSVQVAVGDAVAAGSVLGQIGLSGLTQFPHVHFAVRKDGSTIDPFGAEENTSCGLSPSETLWAPLIPYQPSAIMAVGFAPAIPTFAAIKAGTAAKPLRASDPALVLWAYAYGKSAGDRMEFSITGPGGVRHNWQQRFQRDQAEYFLASGLRKPAPGWPPGDYTGTVTLHRVGHEPDWHSLSFTLMRR